MEAEKQVIYRRWGGVAKEAVSRRYTDDIWNRIACIEYYADGSETIFDADWNVLAVETSERTSR